MHPLLLLSAVTPCFIATSRILYLTTHGVVEPCDDILTLDGGFHNVHLSTAPPFFRQQENGNPNRSRYIPWGRIWSRIFKFSGFEVCPEFMSAFITHRVEKFVAMRCSGNPECATWDILSHIPTDPDNNPSMRSPDMRIYVNADRFAKSVYKHRAFHLIQPNQELLLLVHREGNSGFVF